MNEAEQRLEAVGLLCEECDVLTIDHARGWRALLTGDDPAEVATYWHGTSPRKEAGSRCTRPQRHGASTLRGAGVRGAATGSEQERTR